MKMSLHENEPVGAWSTLSYESELRRETHSDREAKKKKKKPQKWPIIGLFVIYEPKCLSDFCLFTGQEDFGRTADRKI